MRSKVLGDVTKNKWSELHFRYGEYEFFSSQLGSIQLFSFQVLSNVACLTVMYAEIFSQF